MKGWDERVVGWSGGGRGRGLCLRPEFYKTASDQVNALKTVQVKKVNINILYYEAYEYI